MTTRLFIAFAAALALPSLAFAQVASPCDGPNVHALPREQNSAPWSYRYQFFQSKDPHAPLVIFIPGGPGQNSITTQDPRVSDDYSLLLTDPRSSGCNDLERFTKETISSEAIAGDIIELIRQLKPTQDYIIHGHSFGTVVATIVSAKIATLDLKQPRAIYLEGTVGKRTIFRKDGFGWGDSWDRIMNALTKERQEALRSREVNPFGLGPGEWLNVTSILTYFGEVAWLGLDYETFLPVAIASVSGQAAPQVDMLDQISRYGNPLPSNGKASAAIACNELFDQTSLDVTYARGRVWNKDETLCEADRLNPYDSAKWQMGHPTVYFMGENDPSTPLAEGIYHFEHQLNLAKTALVVKRAGHMPLAINLRDCLGRIYASAGRNAEELAPAISSCAASVEARQDF